MNIEQIKENIGDFGKDIKINLGNILSEDGAPGLKLNQIMGIALASAYATKNDNKKIYSVEKILVLSRISKSKNIEMSIDGFLNSDLKNSSIDIIGGPLNKKDKEYFERLKIQYKDKRVNFLGKVTHKDLPEILSKYDVHINSAGNGFFDKSVLETLSCGLINIYRNSDFNYIFKDSKFNFKNEQQLVEKINEVSKLNSEELEQVFKTIDRSLKDNSLSTLNERLRNYL